MSWFTDYVVPNIPVVGGLVSSFLENKSKKEIAEKSFAHDIQMMKYQNEYNDPSNQMKRLAKAGLNPNLVYGSGNVSGNLTGNLPKYQQESDKYDLNFLEGSQMMQQYQDVQLKKVMMDKVEADTNAINTKVVGESIRNDILATKNLRDSFEFGEAKKMAPFQLQMKEELAKKTAQDAINAVKTGDLRDSEMQTKVLQRAMIAQQIANLKIEGATKAKLFSDLESGIWTNAPWFVRMAKGISERLGLDVETIRAAWENASKVEKDAMEFMFRFKSRAQANKLKGK